MTRRLGSAIFATLFGSIIAGIAACGWTAVSDGQFKASDAILIVPMTALVMFPLLILVAFLASRSNAPLPNKSLTSLGPPLVVGVLHTGEEDLRHSLYCQAYGIEMQINSDGNAELILLVPPGLLDTVTEETAVTGEDAGSVSAGISDLEYSSDGVPAVAEITDEKNNWLMVGHPSVGDSESMIFAKSQAAIRTGCRLVVCIAEASKEHIAARLAGFADADASRLVVALVHPKAMSRALAASAAELVRNELLSRGISGEFRFVVAGRFLPGRMSSLRKRCGVDGLLIQCETHDGFGGVLEALEGMS